MKIGRFAFLRPPLGDLGATYNDHLRLIGKRVVDLLLALIQLFSLGITAEELRAIIGWKSAISFQRGSVDPKFHVEGVAPINHSSSQKTRIIVLSYGIKIRTDLSSILSGITCYEIGCQLLLITNRKSHTGFRLVPTSMTVRSEP